MPEILAILTLLLLGGYVLILLRYRIVLRGKKAFTGGNSGNTSFISVIIPARNEEKNIGKCLQSLKRQDYSDASFEIIVVDDHSGDGTAEIVKGFAAGNLKLIHLKDYVAEGENSFKKKALEAGISVAKGELIVTTDADCSAGKKWLSTINNYYLSCRTSFIVMPVGLEGEKKPLDVFETLDFMSMQGIGMAAVEKDRFNLCNGANLAYTAEAFKAVGGFAGIDKLASGDDMLLMEKIRARGYSIGYLLSEDAIVTTPPAGNILSFLKQRTRWASKTTAYQDKRILWLWGWIYLLNLCILLLAVNSVFGCGHMMECGKSLCLSNSLWMILAVKTIAELMFLIPVAGFFDKRKWLLYFPLAQPFHIVYIVMTGLLGLFGNYEWKGRRVR